jgi:hypothetical protein
MKITVFRPKKLTRKLQFNVLGMKYCDVNAGARRLSTPERRCNELFF